MTRVLGIDPGTRRLGWGVVERVGMRLAHVAHGVIATDTSAPICDRLVQIERELDEVLREHRPGAASVESLFFGIDAQAASKLGHARGVALLVCARAGLGVAEYPPARVKLSVAGTGRADKTQVAQMIRTILKLAVAPPSDAADALALAVTHLQRLPFHSLQAVSSASLASSVSSAGRHTSTVVIPKPPISGITRRTAPPKKAVQ